MRYPEKQYRLGKELDGGQWTIEVADVGSDHWRQRETCPTLDWALTRIATLTKAQRDRRQSQP
jgi:hypothetical protein